MDDHSLAKERTKLANQRTYLSYIRTVFLISAAAVFLRKWYIVALAVFMVIMSTLQYYKVLTSISTGETPSADYSYLPLIYSAVALTVFYLQFAQG